jgi:DIS3-like exonuclease 2
MESKQLVEEYMLMANILVGEHLFKYCRDKTLLRVHQDIVEDKKEKLSVFLNRIGIKGVDLTDAKSFSHSLERLRASEEPETLEVLNRKFLTCLQQAKYLTVEERDPYEYQHYGLNFPVYTHFTSPIRRYADLLVHRLLTISLKEQEMTRDLIEGIDYAGFADLCSEKSYNARKAGKECQKLFHCLLLKQQGPQVFESLVFDVESQAIAVYIHEINIHHLIKLKDDPRIENTTYFESDDYLRVVCNFSKNQEIAPGLKTY